MEARVFGSETLWFAPIKGQGPENEPGRPTA